MKLAASSPGRGKKVREEIGKKISSTDQSLIPGSIHYILTFPWGLIRTLDRKMYPFSPPHSDEYRNSFQVSSAIHLPPHHEIFAGNNMDFDSALKVVGEFGRYQRKRFILISLSAVPMFFQMLLLVFVAATPKWMCPEGDKRNLKHCKSLESCCASDGSICNGAQFTANFTSIATEWNLLCGQTYKNELAQSLFMAGTLVGAPLIGGLADKHGRKPLWVISYFVNGSLAVLSGLSPSYHFFVALRFLVGIFAGGGGLIIFVLATESIGPSYRGM